ncbi:MAG: UDP-N-acetylmuramate--L-alanine ligase [Candidatus Pacebacteria bacterium]|jgi:UDP-N-acetylmuramate--alanine ligase|nr:UDP-N-acetylmuramate--L-alanine ligase [Candidatus Paceibacterota bacterium]
MAKNFKIHFIGIGGIGVSALARYYLYQGWDVTGSDLAESEITKDLEKLGAKIYAGTNSLKNKMPDLVVYSPAVKKDNPELKEAKKLGIKTMSYPQALGELSKIYKTIAVAGAHGKSTTTAMIGLMMAAAKLDPTVIVGTKVREFGNSNFRHGESEYLVIEACEYDCSFLNYWPQIAVITNIEMDHMECYDSEAKLLAAFREFAGHVPASGSIVYCGDNANAAKAVSKSKKMVAAPVNYSVAQPEFAALRKIMSVPGEHNVANALAAMSVGRLLGIKDKSIISALSKYKGSWRRFDCAPGKIGKKKVTVVSDYAHHPTQIRLTMEAARKKWQNKKVIVVFQPHQAWRTHLLFKDFAAALMGAPVDRVIVTDIYKVAGRESAAIAKKVSAQKLAEAAKKDSVEYVPQDKVYESLGRIVKGGEIILVMGAGNIYDLSKKIVSRK